MTHSKFIILAVVLFLRTTPVLAEAVNRCGGGGEGGPHPLADISSSFKADVKVVPTAGNVQEFLFAEQSNSLIYHNDNHEILKTTDFVTSQKITNSGQPLSRVFDKNERYFASDSAPWVFDRKAGRWHNYALDARPFRHVFWNKNDLYSISSRIDELNNQHINVYKYQVGDTSAKRVCRTITAPAGQHLVLADGHSHPDIYFYRVRESGTGHLISIYSLDVGVLCNLTGLGQYTREIAGPVKSVHVFKSLKSLAVEVEHPENNLLWDSPTGCRYFDIGRLKPLILNYSRPIVATWSADEGMTLVYLDEEKRARVSNAVHAVAFSPISELLPGDVWMANDSRRLFLSPRFEVAGTKALLRMTLGEVP